MTPNAQRFVTPLTLQALSGERVLTDLMDPGQDATFGHLDFSRSADLLVVAPATADLIGKLAAGLADEPVSAVAVATRAPWLLCPAMNTAMWKSPRVRANLATLRGDPGVHLCGPGEGLLADGDVGPGRLAEVPDIVEAVLRLLGPRDLEGLRILVTAGPTREPIDPVRFLSNPSSGRMGFALAEAARARGADVVLVTGPVALPPPAGVELIEIGTAEEMKQAALAELPGARLVIAAAAVADFKPKQAGKSKLKKEGHAADSLELVRTPDVLAALSEAAGKGARRPVFIGFAAETDDLVANAKRKLVAKKLDLVVANWVGRKGSGFGSPDNEAVLVGKSGKPQELARMSKLAMAHEILDRAVKLL
jgi:phosphopantothenoylcysteine decarboxylase/phosphopantothenate--cysteine ligase